MKSIDVSVIFADLAVAYIGFASIIAANIVIWRSGTAYVV